jgi:thiol:disulfide interchange protein
MIIFITVAMKAMKRKFLIFTLMTVLASTHVMGAEVHEPKQGNNLQYDGNVLRVTDDNFAKVIDTFEVVFLKVYAKWCPHC